MSAIRVLLVDDEAEFAAGLSKVLRRRGFEVEVAGGGEAALSLARARPFHVALLDVKMPGLDGIQLLREFGSVAPSTRVILMTGHISVDEEEMFLTPSRPLTRSSMARTMPFSTSSGLAPGYRTDTETVSASNSGKTSCLMRVSMIRPPIRHTHMIRFAATELPAIQAMAPRLGRSVMDCFLRLRPR